jgi:hypothetical protein
MGMKGLIPVQVPINIPATMHTNSSRHPVPIPFHLPEPDSKFVPNTRNPSHGIMKDIKISIGFRFNANIFCFPEIESTYIVAKLDDMEALSENCKNL